jgi:hypothetical protein
MAFTSGQAIFATGADTTESKTAANALTALGITATVAELNYVDGVTSAIQTQLDAKQASDADLTTIAGLTATSDNFLQAKSSAWASRTVAQVSVDLQGTGLITDAVGFRTIPQTSFSAAYPIVAADSGKHLYHPVGDTNNRQVTIPANGSVAFPIGTAITIVNDSPNDVTVVITTDVLAYANVGTITTLTIPQYNQATILKVLSQRWLASGTAGCTTA